MSDEFSQSILLKVVAQICQMVGYHSIKPQSLYFLTDLLRSSIIQLGQTAQRYAEHCGRTCINLNDLSLAFADSDIKPSELCEFLRIVKPLPKPIEVPRYPVTKHELGVSCEDTPSFQNIQFNYHNEPRELLQFKICLSKVRAARESKKRNKKKKKKRCKKCGKYRSNSK